MARFHRKFVIFLVVLSYIEILESTWTGSGYDGYDDYNASKHRSSSRKFECPDFDTIYIRVLILGIEISVAGLKNF